MTGKMKMFFIPAVALSLALLVSCVSPDRYIKEAEQRINDSKRVHSKKYAPGKLNKAQDLLQAAKKEDENNNNDRAIELAKKSSLYGYDAYFESLKKFVAHHRQRLSTARSNARGNMAHIAAEEKYDKAEKIYKDLQEELKEAESLKSKLSGTYNK